MLVLLWLLIPITALVIGFVRVYLMTRPPRPAAMQESMESFSRFRRVLGTKSAEAAAESEAAAVAAQRPSGEDRRINRAS